MKRHRIACIVIIGDGVLHGLATSLTGIIANLDIGIKPVGNLGFQRLTDVDATDGQFIVATILYLGNRTAPGSPGIRFAVTGLQRKTRLRKRCRQSSADHRGSHLLLT